MKNAMEEKQIIIITKAVPIFSDVELKYLIDSIMYGKYSTLNRQKALQNEYKNLSGKNLKEHYTLCQ